MPRPWKHPKTAVYWFRKEVPAALREKMGKRELKWTLATKDRAEALTKYPAALERAERMLAAAREGFTLTPQQAAGMARQWLEGRLEQGDDSLMQVVTVESDPEGEEISDSHASQELSLMKDDFEQGRAQRWVEDDVEAAIRSEGLPILKGSQDYALLVEKFFWAAVTFRRAMHARAFDDYRAPKELEKLPAYKPVLPGGKPRVKVHRLSDALEAWKVEALPSAQTANEWRKTVTLFTALYGDKPVGQISREEVLGFRDNLLGQGKAPGTVKKRVNGLRSIFQVAVDSGKMTANPAANVKVHDPIAPEDKRLALTNQELSLIFSFPVFTQDERPQGGKGEAAYWLPILGLYTGARLTELAQLIVEDVRSENGIDYFHVNTRGEGKRLKNRGSRRKIPIHPDVIRLGFLDYVEERRKVGDVKVFPLLNAERLGEPRPGASWSTWWGRYAREHGIQRTDEKVFHSFRHTFKDACREARIPEEVHDSFTGHKSASIGRKYGHAGVPLKWLAEEMAKLRFANVELPPAWGRVVSSA